MIADLRSDTFTKPSKEMLEYMMMAEVGDDVFGEDPTINSLESMASEMFGVENAIYCPSGTMTNQIGIRINTVPQDEVICDYRSHIYQYEGGGMMANSLVSVNLLDGDRGRITAEMVSDSINPDDIHKPVSRLVGLENTVNKGGGCYYDIDSLYSIRKVCDVHNLSMHLDGARLFNALVETGEDPKQYGEIFDTISICLSKGLGAPVGSLLLGSGEKIKQARRVRKVFGGAMRQAGYIAAAGIYALENNIDRLKEDHARAIEIGKCLEGLHYVEDILPIDTNIIIYRLSEGIDIKNHLKKLDDNNVKVLPFGPREIRMITHLDFDDNHLQLTIDTLKKL